jgi:outer membrane immunogenic protein
MGYVMSHFGKIASCVVLGLSVGASRGAFAADMPLKAPPPPAPALFSWSGGYVGLNAGYGWSSGSANIVNGDPASELFVTNIPFSGTFASSFHQNGGLAGAQAGYNWQIAPNWIVGLETDIQYAHITGSSTHTIFLDPAVFGANFPFIVNSQRALLDWFGTLRGRVGVLLNPNMLVYGTGGLAYGEDRASGAITLAPPSGVATTASATSGTFSFSCSAVGPATTTCYSGSNSRTSLGYAAGAGLEYHLWGNLTAKLEYLHVGFSGQTVNLISPPPSSAGVFLGYGFNREAFDLVRAGLNYKFPVAARGN